MPNEKTYQFVEDLIKDMMDTGYDPDNYPDGYINWMNFNGSFFKGVEDRKPDFWKELLDYMKWKAPTLESDFGKLPEGNIPSVFWRINDRADLKNNIIWQKVTAAMQNGENVDLDNPSGVKDDPETGTNYNYFWNESLSHLIAEYMKSFNGDVELRDGSFVPMDAIKNADAGYSFEQDWVLPTYNIDVSDHDGTLRGDSYEEVRGADAIKSVLKNSNEMQFTRKKEFGQIGWLRLIMPKYLRKVEVEDLNRNFWVIAQTLSAVCAYLFGDNSVKDLFEGILKELVGLWENCLYLWAAAAMVSQKEKVTDIHIEFAPLTNSEIYGYRKFDNFGETYIDRLPEIQARMDYLIQLYSNSHIIIIPELRSGNYKHNYYNKVEYPGMLVYNRNKGVSVWVDFIVDEEYKMEGPYLAVDLVEDFNNMNSLYVDKIGAITENEITYNFKQKFSNILDAEDEWQIIENYKIERAAAEGLQSSMGINYITDVEYGNINMDNREILYNEEGQIETVSSRWQDFPITDFIPDDVSGKIFVVCFSPLKQTGTGVPEKLTDESVIIYLQSTINLIANLGSLTSEQFEEQLLQKDILKLVARAEITTTNPSATYTAQLSEALPYIGRYGSVLLLEQDVLQDATRIGVTLNYLISENMNEQKFAAAYNKAVPYYAAIRTRIPNFTVTYNEADDTITIDDFEIKLYDAAAQAIDGHMYEICSFKQDNPLIINHNDSSMALNYDDSESTSGTLPSAADVPIKHGYYLGELVSSQPMIKAKEYSIGLKEFHGQQLFSATPDQIQKIMEA